MTEAEHLACRLCGGAIATPVSRCPHCGGEIMAICTGCKRYVDVELSQCPDCQVPLVTIADIASELGRRLRIQRPEAPPPPRGILARLVAQVRTWQPLAPIEGRQPPSEEPEPLPEAESAVEDEG